MQRTQGFTLIELMITITIGAIILTFAVPSFNNFLTRYQLDTAESEFTSSVSFARNSAITRNTEITLTPSGTNITISAGSSNVIREVNLGVTITSAPIVFNSRGSINLASGTDTVTVTLQGASESRTLVLNRTGSRQN
ncbi:GspH/FimT family pseudopilin [Spartinivicinus ruber]|uniref:GspH/FimT family pseudopilin n=1 Tax=Spartinivicinus ruber TaxID=2683272 RepID=UPI0013D0E2D6|nr:GspH/FimT family pseudopilin [Spartinivicinus ruber]